MRDKKMPVNPHETASLERAKAEMHGYFFSQPKDGVITVWNPTTDTEYTRDTD